MSHELLREHGFDIRKLRILLNLANWEYLDALAAEWKVDAAALIGTFVDQAIYERIARERYGLTPKGEAAAAEVPADDNPHKWAEGGPEW